MLGCTTDIDFSDEFLKEHVHWIRVCELGTSLYVLALRIKLFVPDQDLVNMEQFSAEAIRIHIFVLHDSVFKDTSDDSGTEDTPCRKISFGCPLTLRLLSLCRGYIAVSFI